PQECFPGPGMCGPGTPCARHEERDSRSASTRELMDSRTAKCALPAAGSGLGPGTYHLRSSINEGLRRAGGPGSCQPFSGDRTKPTGGGHHALEYVVGPGSYDPKPIERSAYSSPPFWSSAKRFDRKSYHLFTGNENPVGVGCYNITEHEKYPQQMRYQSLPVLVCAASNLKQDAYLLERLKPVAKNNWRDFILAPCRPDTSEEVTAVCQT
ncbi:LOW QUALITY PROTEIN: ciliary microtubule-associated protein 2, partial [Phoenicopterus ruber ruber]